MSLPDDSPKRVSSLRPHRPFAGIVWLSAIIVLALLCLVLPPDGEQRSKLAQFIGRFHPLVVHLPIALILLLPVIEVCALFRRGHHLRGAPGFILWIATATAILSTALGWSLAHHGGYIGNLVRAHMWSGCLLSFLCLFALLLRRRWELDGWQSIGVLYVPVLASTVLTLVWTAHQGGQLTHGEKYLTEYMPPSLRSFLGLPATAAALKSAPLATPPSGAPDATVAVEGSEEEKTDVSFYDARIAPALDRTCVSCHNPNKIKGGLRMDTYALLMKGGDSGVSIVPGNLAESELYRRITLPHDDEEFMPSGGKKPLTAVETKWIELWVAAGASETAPLSDFSAAPPPPKVVGGGAVAWAPDYRPKLETAGELANKLGVRVVARSQQPTDGLIVRTASSPARCTDETLAALAPLSEVIVEAELARTRVTDTGLAALSGWKNLRRLDLTATAVTAQGLKPVLGLEKLEVLNLTDSAVDPAKLPPELTRRQGLTIYGVADSEEQSGATAGAAHSTP